VPAGAVVEIGRATRGVRCYMAVSGGIAVAPVLGSRSTDTLSGLGPPRLTDGMTLPVGAPTAGGPAEPPGDTTYGDLELGVRLGPRDDWFVAAELFSSAYRISPLSNRVGSRLAGAPLTRTRAGELPSEGVVLGAIQVPADGQPLIFLADHPTTGGYPVIGVVDDVTPLAQGRPGTTVRFRELD
jgi:allophanate hydrolase subunit 2